MILGFLAMRFHEVKGHWPLLKPKTAVHDNSSPKAASEEGVSTEAKGNATVTEQHNGA